MRSTWGKIGHVGTPGISFNISKVVNIFWFPVTIKKLSTRLFEMCKEIVNKNFDKIKKIKKYHIIFSVF